MSGEARTDAAMEVPVYGLRITFDVRFACGSIPESIARPMILRLYEALRATSQATALQSGDPRMTEAQIGAECQSKALLLLTKPEAE